MVAASITEVLRAVLNGGKPTAGALSRSAGGRSASRTPLPPDPPSGGGRDAAVVEISAQGRRLQVEAEIRHGVLGELRRLARERMPQPGEDPEGVTPPGQDSTR
jgi:hypothetical protein